MNKNSRIILGLMSGTSHDGVDAAVVQIRGSGPEARARLLYSEHYAYAAVLRKKIADSFEGTAGHICRLNFELGEVFARAALACIKSSGIRPHAIASHGQTIYHIPPERGRSGSTFQIGEPAVIARRTGLPVVADFRKADMAAGGNGAPLVPFADFVLFRGKDVRAVQNIGGIANVTVVTPELDEVIAFDTGPGNSLIDEAMKILFGRPLDAGGKTAVRGTPDYRLLRELLGHPYLKKRPPKSTGRELFGTEFLRTLLRGKRLPPADVVRTLTEFTVLSIRASYERFVLPRYPLREIILAGGGAKNGFLVSRLREEFSGIKVSLVDDFEIPTEAKEAMSFAILANETLSGNPSNVPAATGARGKVILGALYRP